MTSRPYAIRVARSRWNQRRTALIQQGQWQPFTAAQPVRDHVNALRAAGMSPARISERTGVGVGTLNYLLFGEPGYPVPAQIRTESARALMAFWPTLDDFAAGARIDETGTLRRLQALATMGWLPAEIAKRTPLSKHTFFNMRPGRRVTAAVARTVRDFYQEYADKPAEDCGVTLRAARYARTWAAARNFAAPIAWDDDTINDPNACPNWTGHCGSDLGFWTHRLQKITMCEPCQQAHTEWKAAHAHLDGPARKAAGIEARAAAATRGIALAEDGRELLRHGCDPDEAAARLGVTRQHLQQELCRHPETEKEAA